MKCTADERSAFEESLVADLRATNSRYPNDPDVKALISPAGTKLAVPPAVATAVGSRASERVQDRQAPGRGQLDRDFDTLTAQGSNLRVAVYAARPGTDTRSELDLLAAVGTQCLFPRSGRAPRVRMADVDGPAIAVPASLAVQPRGDGPREALRLLLVVRNTSALARTAAINTLKALILTAPDDTSANNCVVGPSSTSPPASVDGASRPVTPSNDARSSPLCAGSHPESGAA